MPVRLAPCPLGLSIHSPVATLFLTMSQFLKFFQVFSVSSFVPAAQMALCQVRSYFTHPCRHELCILPLEGNKSHFSHLEPSAGKSVNPDTSSYQTTQDDFSYKVKDVY